MFYEIKHRHQDHFLYTDGSKIDGKTGDAIITKNNTFKYHMPDECSNYTAEAYSILKATQIIKKNTTQENFANCTDSLAVIHNFK